MEQQSASSTIRTRTRTTTLTTATPSLPLPPTAIRNHFVEDYATSFTQNEHERPQQLHMMYHNNIQPDHVSLHPYPTNTNPTTTTTTTTTAAAAAPTPNDTGSGSGSGSAIKQLQQTTTDTSYPHENQNYRLQGVDLSEDDLLPTPLEDTYCNQRATSGSTLVHHHYQQQQQPQHLLLLQQQQQQQHQHRQQQLLSSQYPPYNDHHRSFVVVNNQQQQNYLQQQHHHPNQQQQQHHQQQLTYSQFVDAQSYYNPQNDNHFLMEQANTTNNNSDFRLAPQTDQNQFLYDQNNQSVVVIPHPSSNHLYHSSSSESSQHKHMLPSKQQQQQHHQYNISVVDNFQPERDHISSSQMSSPLSNPYANNQLCNQSQVNSRVNIPTLEQQVADDNQQDDILDPQVVADQAQYVTRLKSDLEFQTSTRFLNRESNDMTNHHLQQQQQQRQTVPAMSGYSTPIRRPSVPTVPNNGAGGGSSHEQTLAPSQVVVPEQCIQPASQLDSNNLMLDGNLSYRTQVTHINNYELEQPNNVNSSQSYVPTTAQRRASSTTGPNVILHNNVQYHPRVVQQQQQQVQFIDNRTYYNSNRIIPNTNNNLQQQPPQQQQQSQHEHEQQQRISAVLANNSSTNNGSSNRALVDRPLNRKQPQQQQQQDDFVDLRSNSSGVSQDWLDTICRHLIDHMNRFGICVIDDFLGPRKGDQILKEVLQLYTSGQHSRGGLVNSNKLTSRSLGADADVIRNDRVIWIDGYEEGCSEINNLIQTLCSVITNSARLSLYSDNGLDKIVINKRTKAHVACYPGNGTRYIKHVDNPNGDGRVITAIYYLNKNWNTKQDGGLLRMFPTGISEVANIEPLFDRVLFFWSDRRNPHEVLPAYRDRFAITVWYIGENRN